MKRIRSALSFSNVIAVLALFLALGGSVYAASHKGRISGARIKPKSLPGNRVKPRSLTGAQLKPGAVTGTQVKAGSLTGRQIVGSSLTGVSASSIGAVYYAVATATLDGNSGSATTAFAACPAGQKAIGGGATVSDDDVAYVNDSGPTVDRNGWEATGRAGGSSQRLTVTAICTTVTMANGSSGPVPSVPPRYR